MKRILIFTLVLSYFVGNAQNIELLYNGNVVGDTLEIEVENLLTRNDIYIDIVNLSTRPMDVKVRKTELSILEGTENSFCFGTYCFETNESHVAFTIPAQDTFSQATQGTNAFHITYMPFNQIGISYIRYTFFNELFPEDSATFVAKLVTSPTSNIITMATTEIAIYPNPAHTDWVTFSFNNTPLNNLNLAIVNAKGQLIYSCSVSQAENRVKIDISHFPAGIYFGLLENKGTIYASQKFIIQ